MIPCPKCGYHNADDAVRCINCGYDILDSNPMPTTDGAANLVPQEPKKRKNSIFFQLIVSGLIIIALIRLGAADNLNAYQNKEYRGTQIENMVFAEITPNPGGEIPTQIPTTTPTALIGMESPVFCKLELALLHNKAEEMGGGGMLTPDRYSQPDKTCVFLLHDKTALAEIGYIRTIHAEGDSYGIQVEISSKTGILQNDRLLFWGTASLAAMDSKITKAEAEETIQNALETETAELGNYDISVREKIIDKSIVISITDRTKSDSE